MFESPLQIAKEFQNLSKDYNIKPEEIVRYKYNLKMPKRWRSKRKPRKHKNWGFCLVCYGKTGRIRRRYATLNNPTKNSQKPFITNDIIASDGKKL